MEKRERIKARNDRIRGRGSREKLKGKAKGVGVGGGRITMSGGKRNGEETTDWEEISACFVGAVSRGGRCGLWRKDERKAAAPQRFSPSERL